MSDLKKLDTTEGTNYSNYSVVDDENTKKILVIGKGRFGSACAQGLKDAYIEVGTDASLVQSNVSLVSATRFMSSDLSSMIEEIADCEFVVYCGTQLPNHSSKLARAMREAKKMSEGEATMEFIDFSNPDPVYEKHDVSGAIDMHLALTKKGDNNSTVMGNDNEENWSASDSSVDDWKVWKITEVGSLDVAGTEGTSRGIVYGAGVSDGEVPRVKMPGLHWVSAPSEKSDLFSEAHLRIMERAEMDRWWDGNVMGLAVFCFTAFYAITRYSVDANGSEPNGNIPMYLLDKAFAWTGLWMMAVSPFAGNVLALGALYNRFSSLPFLDKFVTLFSTILMIIPTIFFSISWVLWAIFRNYWFSPTSRGGKNPLYQTQFNLVGTRDGIEGSQDRLHSMLVDMVTLKGETGNVGFMYALIHSFLGFIVCDVAYKGYWFEPNGRLGWRFELSMTTGAISTTFLFCVALRSLFGHASWIKLKPIYAYMSPLGMWFAVVHVMAFGAKGWNTLFNKNYHNGQMSITFVSSMFPACIFLTHHFMGLFGTKKRVSDKTLWKNSFIHMGTQDFKAVCNRATVKTLEEESRPSYLKLI